MLQYVQCILHGLTTVFLCVPFIFADRKAVAHDGFFCIMGYLIISTFHRGHFDNRGAFQKVVYICTAVYNGLNLAYDEA